MLCAGLIGFRALRMTGDARRLGSYGFGSAAHILAQIARAEGREVFAITRPGEDASQRFARPLTSGARKACAGADGTAHLARWTAAPSPRNHAAAAPVRRAQTVSWWHPACSTLPVRCGVVAAGAERGHREGSAFQSGPPALEGGVEWR